MARLHQTQIKNYAGNLKADEPVQRSGRASDRQDFELALKIAKREKIQKNDGAVGSPVLSDFDISTNDMERWYRHTDSAAATVEGFQSNAYFQSAQTRTEPDHGQGTYLVRDFSQVESVDSDISAKQLDEIGDWLDKMLDREHDRAGSWTFEFETKDAELVELRLFCHDDGQWSACIDLQTTADDQQKLADLMSKKGVSLSWADLS